MIQITKSDSFEHIKMVARTFTKKWRDDGRAPAFFLHISCSSSFLFYFHVDFGWKLFFRRTISRSRLWAFHTFVANNLYVCVLRSERFLSHRLMGGKEKNTTPAIILFITRADFRCFRGKCFLNCLNVIWRKNQIIILQFCTSARYRAHLQIVTLHVRRISARCDKN